MYIPDEYNEPHRFYHNVDHIQRMLDLVKNMYTNEKIDHYQKSLLDFAVMYHDIVYNPTRTDNEEESVTKFVNINKLDNEFSESVVRLIMVTKTQTPEYPLDKVMLELDWDVFINGSYLEIQEVTLNIYKEYAHISIEHFKRQRVIFLQKMYDKYIGKAHKHAIDNAIQATQELKVSLGVVAGSFNPFHKGHKYLVDTALTMFDKVLILDYGDCRVLEIPRCEYINAPKDLFIGTYIDMMCKCYSNVTLVRGVRNATDLEYEQTYAEYLRELGFNYNIIHLLSPNSLRHISSTSIRQLQQLKGIKYEHINQNH